MNSFISDEQDNLEVVEHWIDALGIDHGDLGIIIAPEHTQTLNAIEISYNIRVLNDDYEGRLEIDGSYTINDTDPDTVMDELYPDIVEYFEERFEEAEIHHYPLKET